MSPPSRSRTGDDDGEYQDEFDGGSDRAGFDRGPLGVGPAWDGPMWIWGFHAVKAALDNPKRKILEAHVTRNGLVRLDLSIEQVNLVEPRALDRLLPDGAVHQGMALKVEPLEDVPLKLIAKAGQGPLLILDEVTDPQNVGAIWRTAAAFSAKGVVLQTRRSATITGIVVKAAAGALEVVPEVREVNLARTLAYLNQAGWVTVGLESEATQTLSEAMLDRPGAPVALVVGAEGKGLRPSVAQACSILARIPMPGAMESLNVSNAAAIGLYEVSRRVSA
jgi:23S rRNA (guanosine2251-2'-O)-methyltransferase